MSASSYRIALSVPVSCPASIIERSADRQTGVPAEDPCELPTTNEGICHSIDVAEEGSTASKWKLPQGIRVDDMTDVKVRIRVAISLTQRIQDERATELISGLKA